MGMRACMAGGGGVARMGAASRGAAGGEPLAGEHGHVGRDCTYQAGEIEFLKERLEELKGKGPCFHCHEMGHTSGSCPKKHQGRSVTF